MIQKLQNNDKLKNSRHNNSPKTNKAVSYVCKQDNRAIGKGYGLSIANLNTNGYMIK